MNVNFSKSPDGLVPAIVQDGVTDQVLMVGFMNDEALAATEASGRVTFFSRSKQRLWVKGESSGNFLDVVSITPDCDNDTLLIKAKPHGPVCHSGSDTCFGGANNAHPLGFLVDLDQLTIERQINPTEESYVSRLFEKGLNKIAQKVGEEAVETIIAAKDDDLEAFTSESADLLFHLMVLLRAKNSSFAEVVDVLRKRSKTR